MQRNRSLLALPFLLLLSPVISAQSLPLKISLSAETATISNVSPGGSVVVLSEARGLRGGMIAPRRFAAIVNDSDRDGIVVVTPADGVSLRSVWIAVDTQSGAVSTAAPPEFPLRVRPLGSSALKKDVSGGIAELVSRLPRLHLLLVRPKGGAWFLGVHEGGRDDRDGAGDGKLTAAFEDAVAIQAGEKAPKHLKTGDIVVAVDPGHLDVFLAEMGK